MSEKGDMGEGKTTKVTNTSIEERALQKRYIRTCLKQRVLAVLHGGALALLNKRKWKFGEKRGKCAFLWREGKSA